MVRFFRTSWSIQDRYEHSKISIQSPMSFLCRKSNADPLLLAGGVRKTPRSRRPGHAESRDATCTQLRIWTVDLSVVISTIDSSALHTCADEFRECESDFLPRGEDTGV